MTGHGPTTVEDVTVVGGGDAGKLAALIFKAEQPSLDVRVIDDPADPPREVGKSTFSSITSILHDHLGIDREEFFREVTPVWKHSVYFEDWTGEELFTPFDLKDVFDMADRPLEDVHYRYRNDSFETINQVATAERKAPFVEEFGGIDFDTPYPYVAYHLNVYNFDDYLRGLLVERGVDLVEDRIESVVTDGEWVTRIEGEQGSYEADLYVDATGFGRVLASQLPVEFSEFDFPLDAAVVTQVPIDLAEIVPATVVRTLDSGWTWQIDTTEARDLGYVYASEYADRETAEREFRERHEIPESADVAAYSFTSGRFDRAWVGNCLVAGDAFAFVEPLQATSLSTHAHIIYDVVKQLTDNNWTMHDGLRQIVDGTADGYWTEIYDFLTAFYRYSRGETPFWEYMRTVGDDADWAAYENTYRSGAGFLLARSKADREITFGRVFNVYQTDYTMYDLGVPIELHESGGVEVGDRTSERVDDVAERIHNTVEGFLTYPEVYSEEYLGDPTTKDHDGVEESADDKFLT